MKVLVVGKGGREHALVRALSFSPSVDAVHCLPGSSGMLGEAICYPNINSSNFSEIIKLIKKNDIDLVVIGPEAEITSGLPDQLRQHGIDVFAPSQAAAQLEASKIFSKRFMVEAGVPTARFVEVSSTSECMEKSRQFDPPFVLKADGLAAGKGVFICQGPEDLKIAATHLFDEKVFGEAGARAILEEHQEGWEISYLVITNGVEYKPLPLSQDHKRLKDKDEGPNTGGMGTVGPLKIDLDLEEAIHREILKPTIDKIKEKKLEYRGVLYVGVMVTPKGPKVLEYNVRFGDPEAQVILPLLEGDWGEVFKSVARGELMDLNWRPLYCSCVVLAAEGYPQTPVRGAIIEGQIKYQTPSSYFLHAGTALSANDEWITQGGRVLNAIGIGSTLKESVDLAYSQASKVSWVGMQLRKDIGARA